MIIVNAKENQPARIYHAIFPKATGLLTEKFLDVIVTPGRKTGVKRNNYYLINADLQFNFNRDTQETRFFIHCIEWCQARGYDYLMLVNR